MPDVRPDPKPVTEGGIGRRKPRKGWRKRGRITATRAEWELIVAAKGDACRLEGVRVGNEQYHHLVPRALGGDDVADNIVPLCMGCHTQVTQHHRGFTRLLAESLTDAEYAYIIGKLGEGGPARLFGV